MILNPKEVSVYSLPELARQGIKSISCSEQKMHRIIKAVLVYYNTTWEKVNNKTRKREVVKVRHIIMYLLKKHTDLTLKAIALLFKGKYDHSSVIHASQSIINDIDTGLIRDEINEIIQIIER